MLILLSILLGFVASFISSVFGGGFGLLAIPAIYWLIVHSYPDIPNAMQITIATSIVSSIPLSLIASYRQSKYRNIDFHLYKSLAVSMTISALFGMFLATIIDSANLKLLFAIIIFITAIMLWKFNIKQKDIIALPDAVFKTCAMIISALSCFIGVSVFTVPFLMFSGIEIKRAIGTSMILVLTYSSIAGIAMAFLGIPMLGISTTQFGYLNIPIFLSTIVPCIIGAIIGTKCVHIMSGIVLKRIFVAMMLFLAIVMAF